MQDDKSQMKKICGGIKATGLALLIISTLACVFEFSQSSAQQSPAISQQTPQQKPQKPDPKNPSKDQPKEKPEEDEDDGGQILRVGTQLVNVLFSVNDKQNRYINDLTKEDVIVLEDGKPQQIFTFKKETDLPLTMALLVDVSESERYVLPALKDAGDRFFRSTMREGKDTAAVIKFQREPTLMQGLTSNTTRLRKALDEVAMSATPMGGIYGGPTPPINSGVGGTSIYDSVIATSADLLAGEAGRKTMILLTDGVDTTSRMKISEAITEALRAEASIYAIGIGDSSFDGVNEGVLKKLCEETGGRAYFPKRPGDLERAFAQLETDLRQQYLLAYEPENSNQDGAFHKIEVRLGAGRDSKDIRVRHRRGYYAPKPRKN
jgi:VWFA-related protein